MDYKDELHRTSFIVFHLKDELHRTESRTVKTLDDTEQYSRRLCLRINGVTVTQGETAEECMVKCKGIFHDLNVSIPDDCIDRAHRIGLKKSENGEETQPIIIRFTTC